MSRVVSCVVVVVVDDDDTRSRIKNCGGSGTTVLESTEGKGGGAVYIAVQVVLRTGSNLCCPEKVPWPTI
jgi:hypothetical protein